MLENARKDALLLLQRYHGRVICHSKSFVYPTIHYIENFVYIFLLLKKNKFPIIVSYERPSTYTRTYIFTQIPSRAITSSIGENEERGMQSKLSSPSLEKTPRTRSPIWLYESNRVGESSARRTNQQ